MSIINKYTHIIEVWGDFSVFARPEFVERFSYPAPTPSAARGIFDAIYFKPQFYWQVEKIELLSTPAYIALRRNEVDAKAPSDRTIKSWASGNTEISPIRADSPEHRQQRQTMALRNPKYRLHAHIVPREGFENQQKAYDNQFIRRARAGKNFQQPFMGARECVAFYRLVEDLASEPSPVDYNQNIGWMLYDVFDLSESNDSHAKPFITMFHAKIVHGVLYVPPFGSDDIRKPGKKPDSRERRAG